VLGEELGELVTVAPAVRLSDGDEADALGVGLGSTSNALSSTCPGNGACTASRSPYSVKSIWPR
jgi:hypothetical protein